MPCFQPLIPSLFVALNHLWKHFVYNLFGCLFKCVKWVMQKRPKNQPINMLCIIKTIPPAQTCSCQFIVHKAFEQTPHVQAKLEAFPCVWQNLGKTKGMFPNHKSLFKNYARAFNWCHTVFICKRFCRPGSNLHQLLCEGNGHTLGTFSVLTAHWHTFVTKPASFSQAYRSFSVCSCHSKPNSPSHGYKSKWPNVTVIMGIIIHFGL